MPHPSRLRRDTFPYGEGEAFGSRKRTPTRASSLFALVLAAGEAETLDVFDTDPAAISAPILARLARRLWTIRRWLECDAALPEPVAQFWMPRHLEPQGG